MVQNGDIHAGSPPFLLVPQVPTRQPVRRAGKRRIRLPRRSVSGSDGPRYVVNMERLPPHGDPLLNWEKDC